jgi:hypothetical protein
LREAIEKMRPSHNPSDEEEEEEEDPFQDDEPVYFE